MTMKILIEVPTWLGDCVMATPSLRNIINEYKNLLFLEQLVTRSIIRLQSCIRGFLLRQKLKRKDEYKNVLLLEQLVTRSIIRLQACARGFLFRQTLRRKQQYKNILFLEQIQEEENLTVGLLQSLNSQRENLLRAEDILLSCVTQGQNGLLDRLKQRAGHFF